MNKTFYLQIRPGVPGHNNDVMTQAAIESLVNSAVGRPVITGDLPLERPEQVIGFIQRAEQKTEVADVEKEHPETIYVEMAVEMHIEEDKLQKIDPVTEFFESFVVNETLIGGGKSPARRQINKLKLSMVSVGAKSARPVGRRD